MRVIRLSAVPAPSALRVVGLLVVIAGLFGMHGLASHGVEGMDAMHGTALAAPALAGSPMYVDGSSTNADRVALAATEDLPSVTPGGAGHGGMDMDIAMLCLAILGAALLALAHRLVAQRSVSSVLAYCHRSPMTLHSPREPAPPNAMGLSIQRC